MMTPHSEIADRINAAAPNGLRVRIKPTPDDAYIAVWWWDVCDTSAESWGSYWSDLSSLEAVYGALMGRLTNEEMTVNIFKDTDLFPYMSGLMFNGRDLTFTVTRVKLEKLQRGTGDGENKPVVYFKETNKGLVLNKTNAKSIARVLGPETDDWVGAKFRLYAVDISAFGEQHRTVRVRNVIPARGGNAVDVDDDDAHDAADKKLAETN